MYRTSHTRVESWLVVEGERESERERQFWVAVRKKAGAKCVHRHTH